MVYLYSTHCPLCERLEKRLREYDIDFTIIDDENAVGIFCHDNEIDTVPVLWNDGLIMDYGTAMRWAKGGGSVNAD